MFLGRPSDTNLVDVRLRVHGQALALQRALFLALVSETRAQLL